MKRLLNLFFCLSAVMMLSVPQFAAAQTAEVTVSGKVSDQNGLPIIGAGVVLSSDSSTGTTTDLDGNWGSCWLRAAARRPRPRSGISGCSPRPAGRRKRGPPPAPSAA